MKKTNLLPFFFFFFLILSSFNFLELMGKLMNESFQVESFSRHKILSITDIPYTHHVEPTLAISANGTIFAGWKDAFSHDGGGVRVSFSKSVDGGFSWTPPFYMPNFEGLNTGQSDPWMVWDESSETLYYAYLEYSMNYLPNNTILSQITVARSLDYGQTWIPVKASDGIGVADKETMTVSSDGTIYVVYDDLNLTDDNYEVFVRLTRSTDGGVSYDEVNIIADSVNFPDDHIAPYVACDSNNNVYVAWLFFTDGNWGDVYLVKSSDQGVTFSDFIDINSESENATANIPYRVTLPVIRFDQNDRLYVLWAEKYEIGAAWDCYIKYSDDYGQNWSPRYQVNPEGALDQWNPEMTIDSLGRCHIIYYDMKEEAGEEFFKPYYRMVEFADNLTGLPIFSDPLAIASSPTSSVFTRPGEYMAIRFDSENVPHVVWSDGRYNEMDIFYARGILQDSITTTSETSKVSTVSSTTPETSKVSTVSSTNPPSTTSTTTSIMTRSTTTNYPQIVILCIFFGIMMIIKKKNHR
ncbi:MAG: sialidase family protein [Promethearchaeota archaeon]